MLKLFTKDGCFAQIVIEHFDQHSADDLAGSAQLLSRTG